MEREDIAAIVKLINSAEKPVAYVGGGVVASDACKELVELLEKADIPVAYTLMAAGVVGYDNELNLGLVGMHGSVAAIGLWIRPTWLLPWAPVSATG